MEPREPATDPRAEYVRRLDRRRGVAEHLKQREGHLALARLAAFLALAALSWPALGREALSPAWLLPPLALFVALVAIHDRTRQRRQRLERAAALCEAGLRRLDHTWIGTGTSGERFRDPHHPYADDLDLFGRGSVFELLCTARTHTGEEVLASWLLHPSSPDGIRRRQQAVAELAPRLDLREDLALVGDDQRAALEREAVRTWAARPHEPESLALRVLTFLLPALTLGALAAWLAGVFSLRVFLAMLVAELITLRVVGSRIERTLSSFERPSRDLQLLASLFARLEAEDLRSPHLAELMATLRGQGLPPSVAIGRLGRLHTLLDSAANQFFAPFAFVLLWNVHLSLAIERWRRAYGPLLVPWISALAEVEALSSFATYAWEHPDDPFPEIVEQAPALLEGEGLGHPLLDPRKMVRNDIGLSGDLRLLLISGSNMSGKSTYLRTVGTNAVLALAGAPVRARTLRLSPLAVGATIRVIDSLHEGSSRFHAEILRLRQLVDLARGERPLLFLLDEILHGTNSHDRRLGAEAVVRGLLEAGALGLVTTHDLALARVAGDLGARARNVHFQDEMTAGRMSFDYRLRPGVVEKSNAIALMRAVGLDV